MSYSMRIYAVSIRRILSDIGGPRSDALSVPARLAADELEARCAAVGRRLPSTGLTDTSVSYLNALARAWPWAASLIGPRVPAVLPVPAPDDFPLIGHLTSAEIAATLSAWDDADLEAVSAELSAGAATLLEAMDAARSDGTDLIACTS